MMRGATLFSGGGGVECLLKEHINFVHAVEFDPQIAAVYAQNIGHHVQVADVRAVDYSAWGALDYLHASPVCKNFSAAKTNGTESDDDMTTAQAVVRTLEATQPRIFTLENVQQYEGSASYRTIVQWLNHNGYMWHAETLNAANYGVPQTRRRLILRAVRDALLPGLPPPVKWVGWYAAIEDLIPTLPESKFADWQLARLPEEISGTFLSLPENTSREATVRQLDQPSFTILSGMFRRPSSVPSAFIVSNGAIKSNVSAGATRAWLNSGRVVKMSVRSLARFQSIPDWYVLPDKNSLACTIIGNSVPPLLMRSVVLPLL